MTSEPSSRIEWKDSKEFISQAQTRAFTRDLRHHPAYRPDVDGLRALAIIPVVLFHAFPTMLRGGFVGVDIFFVISGFLISGIIFKALQRESFSFPGFYANRIKRIFPALLLVLSACAVFGWFFLLPDEYAQLGKHIVGGAAYLENFILRGEAGYFNTATSLKPLMHLWSLAIEEQFYLTYPLLLWAAWRLRGNLLAIIVPLVLISFSLNLWKVRSDAASAFFLPQTRFWELWTGGALAYIDIFKPEVPRRFTTSWAWLTSSLSNRGQTSASSVIVSNAVSIVGLALIGLSLLLVREYSFPGYWGLLPVGGAALLILAGPSAWINRGILSNRVAVFVGLISYPLYLWHWPILSFGRIIRGEELSRGTRIAALGLSFLLAWATWRFVESPIRFGRRIWIKTAALAAISVVIACVGYKIHDRDGFADRLKGLAVDLDWAHPDASSTSECRKTVNAEKMGYCRISGEGPPSVLLVGDSHAEALYHGLAPAYAQRSQTVMNLGEPGCVPFYDTESYTLGMRQERDCRPIVNRMLDFATSTPSVRTIILSVRGPMNMFGRELDADPTGPTKVISWDGAPKNSSQADIFAAAFRNTVSRLSASGKDVVLFVDWPELGFDPRSCLPRPVPLFSHVRPLCGVPRPQVDDRNRAYREVILDMQKEFGQLRVFDPLPYLCNATACYAIRDGHLLYRDGNHLSAAGSMYLGEKFLAEQSRTSP
ncbi:MAG TPA: acyltransferase family protein [Candidatus Binatus sp.]|nr:acyltransferase family protein [Candidatus Binatus sp.]